MYYTEFLTVTVNPKKLGGGRVNLTNPKKNRPSEKSSMLNLKD